MEKKLGFRFSSENNPSKHRNYNGKNNPMFGRKRPDLSEYNTLNKKGKKNPEHSEWMKANNPMKGKKNLAVSEYNRNNKKGKPNPKGSEWLKNGGAAYLCSLNKSPSKPQVKLFEMVKLLYPSAVLNYPYLHYCIDVAIPELKIAIEYDEPFWHKDKESDTKRQSEIEQGGWRFIRYTKLPESIKF